jgi:hypothetical protein
VNLIESNFSAKAKCIVNTQTSVQISTISATESPKYLFFFVSLASMCSLNFSVSYIHILHKENQSTSNIQPNQPVKPRKKKKMIEEGKNLTASANPGIGSGNL